MILQTPIGKKNKKPLNSGVQINQILINDEEVCILLFICKVIIFKSNRVHKYIQMIFSIAVFGWTNSETTIFAWFKVFAWIFLAPERLKSALKEKEQKIEQLMKERQLERAEIAKASIQTEVAETELVNIKREFMSQKGQSQEQLKNLQEALQVRNLFLKKTYTYLAQTSAH